MVKTALIMCLALLIVPVTFTNVMAATADEVRHFADTVGTQALNIVNSSGGTDQKKKQLEQLFSQNVDIPWMGKFVLGPGWQKASLDQRDRYMKVFTQYLLARYTTNFAEYNGTKYTITDVRDVGNGEFEVSMKINAPNARQQQDIDAGYRIHSDDRGQLKISDIIIESVSLITTQRSEFASVLQSSNMDTLITDIENKTKQEQQQQ